MWTSYPIIPLKEGGQQGVLSGFFQDDTMLIKQTAVPNGGPSFRTWSAKRGVSIGSFGLPIFDAHGNLGQVYGIEYNTTYGPHGPISSYLDVYSVDAPSSGGVKKLAALPADTLVARAEFTGDGDSAYVLVASYSNASDASTGPVLFNTDLWKVPRNGAPAEKRVVHKNTPYFDLFPNIETLHMLKVPSGPLLVAAQNGSWTDKNYTQLVYEVDFHSNTWDVKISGDHFGTPVDGGNCAAYDPSAHEWHLGCGSIGVIDLNALKVVRRYGVTHQKPGTEGGGYSLGGTAFLPSSKEALRMTEVVV
jgi:hypothetical protein